MTKRPSARHFVDRCGPSPSTGCRRGCLLRTRCRSARCSSKPIARLAARPLPISSPPSAGAARRPRASGPTPSCSRPYRRRTYSCPSPRMARPRRARWSSQRDPCEGSHHRCGRRLPLWGRRTTFHRVRLEVPAARGRHPLCHPSRRSWLLDGRARRPRPRPKGPRTVDPTRDLTQVVVGHSIRRIDATREDDDLGPTTQGRVVRLRQGQRRRRERRPTCGSRGDVSAPLPYP